MKGDDTINVPLNIKEDDVDNDCDMYKMFTITYSYITVFISYSDDATLKFLELFLQEFYSRLIDGGPYEKVSFALLSSSL